MNMAETIDWPARHHDTLRALQRRMLRHIENGRSTDANSLALPVGAADGMPCCASTNNGFVEGALLCGAGSGSVVTRVAATEAGAPRFGSEPSLGAVTPAGGSSRLPALSVAVPAAMLMPRVPSPLIPDSVTVRVVPLPLTPTVPAVALPVAFTVTLSAASVLALKFSSAYVTV